MNRMFDGTNFKAARIAARKTIIEVTAETGFSRATLYRLENNENICRPREDTMQILAHLYGITLEELLQETPLEEGEPITIGRVQYWPKSGRIQYPDGSHTHTVGVIHKLMGYLLERKGQIVSRDQILSDVWDQNPKNQTRVADMGICTLRKLFQDPDPPNHFEAVRHQGYRFSIEGWRA